MKNTKKKTMQATLFATTISLSLWAGSALASGSTYTVQKGDTLSAISKRTGVSITSLKSLNNLKSDLIYTGEVLKLSASTPTVPTSTTPTATAGQTTGSTYTVKSGDCLSTIASKNNMTVTQLKSLNGLTSDVIRVGQVLKLSATPAPAPTPVPVPTPTTTAPSGNTSATNTNTAQTTVQTYTVQSGDCLSKIASKYSMTVTQLKSLNGLTSDVIRVGQVLKVSVTSTTAPTTATTPSPTNNTTAPVNDTTSTTTTYVVKSGDTLSKIASAYQTTYSNLMSLNHLTSTLIRVGQTLQVPSNTSNLASPPTANLSSKEVNKAVLGYTIGADSLTTMRAYTKDITEIATATYTVSGSGALSGSAPSSQIQYANQNQMNSTVMIGNDYNQSVAHALLSSSTNRANLINNTLSVIKANGYKGVNIDIENIKPTDRDYYTALVKEMSNKLKPLGYTVAVSLPAKTSDNSQEYWVYGYDYKSIAPYIDEALIMTYDEHYMGGMAGAIASMPWITNVINYTKTVIPKDKILLGVATYGYDWANGVATKAWSDVQIDNLIKQYNATVVFDQLSKTPYFQYWSNGVKHTVWFENAQSFGYKLDLVNSSGIKGIGIWRLGLENNSFWQTVESKF